MRFVPSKNQRRTKERAQSVLGPCMRDSYECAILRRGIRCFFFS